METQNDTTSGQNDDRHVIQTYLSDMLALERHISAPVDSQSSSQEHQEYTEAIAVIRQIKATTDDHIAALEEQLSAAGGHAASGIKSAWSALLGGGAAAINQVRKTKVSKSLRDDYTALSLAAISYTMLHATASGLGDRPTAALAKRHLDDLTPIIVSISKVIPGVVLQELRDTGENVRITAAELTERAAGESWSAKTTGGSGAVN